MTSNTLSTNVIGWLRRYLAKEGNEGPPLRYRSLRRNMVLITVLVVILPLLTMAVINHFEYQKVLEYETIEPLKILVNKTKHSFDLFLTERLSAVSFIASAYSLAELADQQTLSRIFQVMKREFGGFVDLGLIDSSGMQVSYVGPYNLGGKGYQDHDWFQEVMVRGTHISNVFLGYRKFPHFVIAVRHEGTGGVSWVLRATIDTEKYNSLIAAMGLDSQSDAFIIDRSGVFQTDSRFYGRVLEQFPMPIPPVSLEPGVLHVRDSRNREILLSYVHFASPPFILIAVKPHDRAIGFWYTPRRELFFVFLVSVIAIFLVVLKLTDVLVRRIEESDYRREVTYHEMEQSNKLASIGRLAAGVAHEINNPMAIINEKAGLMEDLIGTMPQFPAKERFLQLTESIQQSVERCSAITHRLLGFARRMDVEYEEISLNDIIREVFGFLEKEAFHRNVNVRLDLADDIPKILTDHGQLQQVFLNILSNAFLAVQDGGEIVISSRRHTDDTVAASIQDNGVGMSDETMKHIFEPFFSSRKGYGTGLGLSITYGIVKKLGGEIEVQSKEGEGATFTVALPIGGKQETEA